MNYLDYPRILFFKLDDNPITVEALKEKTWEFLGQNFPIDYEQPSYGSVNYQAPERDNQFMETYTSDKYYTFTLLSGEKFTLNFYTEASDKGDFVDTWIYNFYQFSIYCLEPTSWEWVKKIWDTFKPFLLEMGFRDSTLDFTYISGGLYAFYEKQQNHAATQAIAALTEDEIIQKLKADPQTYIEIQSKPYLDIDKILLQVPHKEKVKSIRIPNNNLTHFPSSIIAYKNLEEIYIYNNKISNLPENFQELKRLRYLHIRGNEIATNNAVIEKLKNLYPNDFELILE